MRRALISLILLLFASALTIGLTLWLEPLDVARSWARWQMTTEGLEERTLQGPLGTLTYFEGGPTEAEPGDAPTLVLIHGMGDQASTWAAVAPVLMERHRLLIPDLPGHGHSAPREGPLTLADERDGLEALLAERAPAEPVVLVGNSMGGWVSLLVAKERPEDLARLVLLNSAGLRGDPGADLIPEDRAEARRLVAAVLGPAAARELPGFFLDDLVEKVREGPTPRLAESLPDADFLEPEELSEIRVPVEVVWGEEDGLISIEYGRRLAEALPAARFHPLPGCAHAPQTGCPDRLLRLLRDLLAREPPALPPSTGAETAPAAEAS